MLEAKSLTGKAVVIGAGTMGGGIAAQLANAGWEVTLLDMPATGENENRNKAAETGLLRILNAKPPLLFLPEFKDRIKIGNTEDDIACLKEADWIIEAIYENRAAKQALMKLIEANAGPRAVVSSNTSGLGLREMTQDCSAEFRTRFLGTHFLNPPRYLKLLEVIPIVETDPNITARFKEFAEQVLGHRVVFAKDTPGFISTRIWITHLLDTIHSAIEQGLSIEEVDYLTGTFLGRPRSATFRMADLVGLDIIANIAANQYAGLPRDPMRDRLKLPSALQQLIETGSIGDKSGAGFYKKEGKEILALDLETFSYRPKQNVKIEDIELFSRLPLCERLAGLNEVGSEPWRLFLNGIIENLIVYVNAIGPEIADDTLSIDRVMEWGFHWEMGPFAIEDCSRAKTSTEMANFRGIGLNRSYRVFGQNTFQPFESNREFIVLKDLKSAGKTVRESEVASLIDLGDGVACIEFHTKVNTFNPELVSFLDDSREKAEKEFAALVIGNQGAHFSTGYNLQLILNSIEAKDWVSLETQMRSIQDVFQRLKYAHVPIIGAPFGYTLGGGCECCLHCHSLQSSPELNIGLPEVLVGVVPTGGGIKELLARAMLAWDEGTDAFPLVYRVFERIVFPMNSGSAAEARKLGYLRGHDSISRNADRLLFDAKEKALDIVNSKWKPTQKQFVPIFGKEMQARLINKIEQHQAAGSLSEHDCLIADHIAHILSGGDSLDSQHVEEEALLQMEREAFMSLVQTPKTADRIRHMLETGQSLKN